MFFSLGFLMCEPLPNPSKMAMIGDPVIVKEKRPGFRSVFPESNGTNATISDFSREKGMISAGETP